MGSSDGDEGSHARHWSRRHRARVAGADRTCLGQGLVLRFLNSHEHIHMLPPLFPVVQSLAREYRIEHVRFPTAQQTTGAGASALLRASIMNTLDAANRGRVPRPVPRFLVSSRAVAERAGHRKDHRRSVCRRGRRVDVSSGRVGSHGSERPAASQLHDWAGELRALTGSRVRRRCAASACGWWGTATCRSTVPARSTGCDSPCVTRFRGEYERSRT